MKKFIAVLAVTVLFAGVAFTPVSAAGPPEGLHCEDHNAAGVTKINLPISSPESETIDGVEVYVAFDSNTNTVTFTDADDNPVVVLFCIKAATDNSGELEGNSGTVDWKSPGSQIPDQSYVVIYSVVTNDNGDTTPPSDENGNGERPGDEDEEDGQVLGEATDQQVAAPVGAVDAGAGGSQAGLSALLGLVVSAVVAAAGLTHRKWSQLFSRA